MSIACLAADVHLPQQTDFSVRYPDVESAYRCPLGAGSSHVVTAVRQRRARVASK
ncbi:hypothetical protein HGRIS_003476 [Hohenbuehelia grisea]|uniref:Uncharacterized protein n=1 Tax=Hohenbuehelia grisea TaxID=104357 RepID=A0ABR3JFK4_9AGAR